MRWILLVAGLGLAANGLNEWRRNAAREAGARRFTCSELEAEGPGEEGKIRLAEFLLCTGGSANEEEVGRWSHVWVPAVPRDGPYHRQLLKNPPPEGAIPAPPEVRVLVELADVRDADFVELVAEQDEITGELVRGVGHLDEDARALVRAAFPNADECWIVRAGRGPIGWPAIVGCLVGGAVLVVFGLRLGRKKA